jgi:hypothetical protein
VLALVVASGAANRTAGTRKGPGPRKGPDPGD